MEVAQAQIALDAAFSERVSCCGVRQRHRASHVTATGPKGQAAWGHP